MTRGLLKIMRRNCEKESRCGVCVVEHLTSPSQKKRKRRKSTKSACCAAVVSYWDSLAARGGSGCYSCKRFSFLCIHTVQYTAAAVCFFLSVWFLVRFVLTLLQTVLYRSVSPLFLAVRTVARPFDHRLEPK